jgi:hypothetical protein
MQYDPKNDFKSDGLFVILEHSSLFPDSGCKVVGITHSYNNALKYVTNSHRKIEGPIPILDTANDFTLPKPITKINYPYIKNNVPLYQPPDFLNKNPFETNRAESKKLYDSEAIGGNQKFPYDSEAIGGNQKFPYDSEAIGGNQRFPYDFSMLTPPPSQVSSASTSPHINIPDSL